MSYSDVVMADAPLGYWRSKAPGVNQGDQVADSTGNGHNLFIWQSPADAPSLISGSADPAISYDAGENFWDGGDPPHRLPFNLTAAVSLSFWMRPALAPVNGSTNRDVVKKGAFYGTELALVGSEIKLFGVITTGASVVTYTLTPAAVLALGSVYHVGFSYDSVTGQIKAYLNGALDSQNAVAPGTLLTNSAGAAFVMGAFSDVAHGYVGDLDECALYDHVLAPARFLAHYQAGAGAVSTTTTAFEAELLAGGFDAKQRGLMAGPAYKLRRIYLDGVADPAAHTLAKTNPKQLKALTDNGKLASFDAITAP